MASEQFIRSFGYDEQVTLRQIKKVFQRLYIVNPNDFRTYAIEILKVIKNNKQLLEKFFGEIRAMS